ncbi:MAG: hypothetical protein R3F22_11245 [Lysobacteraceae bacterium]
MNALKKSRSRFPLQRTRFAALLLACAGGVQAGGGIADDWLSSTHSCAGFNRTDAIHRDSDGTLWVGCGSNTGGYGVHFSQDGGDTWSVPPLSVPDELDDFRVNSISRGADGHLKIGGTEAGSMRMVLSLDTSGASYPVTLELEGVNQIGRLFPVGNYRELSDGSGMAEQSTGTGALFSDGSAGTSAANWDDAGTPEQILDLVVHDDKFWGSGSRIAASPRLFLPPTNVAAEPWELLMVEPNLPEDWEGELWGIAVNDQRLVAAGVNQDGTSSTGKILVSSANPYDMNGYTEHDVSDILGISSPYTWADGVCMRGDTIVVVGRRGNNDGFVVMSTNGAQSFFDATPSDAPGHVSKCLIEPDGTVVVAGEASYIGILPADPVIFAAGFEEDPL